MRLPALAVALLGTLTAAACTLSPDPVQRSFDAGSTLQLHEPLPVEEGDFRVFVQQGQQVTRSEVSRFAPHCSLEIRLQDGDDAVQSPIPVTHFDMGASRVWERLAIADTPGEPVLASASPQMAGLFTRERFQRYRHHTRARLHSDDAPQVHAMLCVIEGERDVRPLSVDQIRGVFGDVATFRVPGEGG